MEALPVIEPFDVFQGAAKKPHMPLLRFENASHNNKARR
jgi:hypothetical protein